MTEYSFAYRLFHHLQTVHQHRKIVRQCCFKCGLYRQGLTHDLSKYSLSELVPSIRYFQGTRSPYSKEKELYGYSQGWLHHKGRNRHHWEYWYDMMNRVYAPVKMPEKYVAESVCDRVAACRTYQKDAYTCRSALEYYESKSDAAFMHPETAALMEKFLKMIAEDGEDAAFRNIKDYLKQLQ